MPAATARDQFVETAGEIVALPDNAGQLGGAGRAVRRAGILAQGFLAHVVFLERQDGKPVDDHARGFRILRAALRSRGLQGGHQRLVDFLDEIVALLVVAVDGALRLIDALEAEVVAAGDVLLVPEQEIAQVVFADQAVEALAGGGGAVLMPGGGEIGLQAWRVGGRRSSSLGRAGD